MIYLVSGKIDASNIEGVKNLSLEESLDIIAHWPVVQFDTETTGLNPHLNRLTSMQFGYKHFDTGEHTEIVVDCNSIDPKEYKYVVEHSFLIGHNLKFDLKFLYNHGIVPLNVYDTMISEQLLYLGYDFKTISFKLSSVLKRYTGIELDKSFQQEIAQKGLTSEGIIYAANDVVHLQDIRKAQMLTAKARNCVNALTVENSFVPAIAYLEWCGIRLDEEKWKAKMDKDKSRLEECEKKLNDYVVSNTKLNTEFVTTYTIPSLFEPPTTTFTPECTVQWSSPHQVVPVCQKLGFNTKVFDKITHKEKDSVDEKTLSVQKGIDDEFLKLYFDYQEQKKLVTTYGQSFLNLINPKTGRLHTNFYQLGTVTGRMSSGGGEKSGSIDAELAALKQLPPKEVRFVNLQNLSARGDIGPITRGCFVPTKGNTFISIDYSAEESRVQADVWNEKRLLDAFEQGIDTHNLYAKMCYPDELKDVDVKDVKSLRPDLRQNAKYFEFELSYGGNGSETAKKLGIDKEKAMANVANVLKEMPGMMAFKKKTIAFLKNHGYIVINEQTGHRIYWPEWSTWKMEEDAMDRSFWEDYKIYHKGTGDDVCKRVKRHMKRSGDWFNKNVLNYPIQGGSAIVLKQAASDFFKWIVDKGYFGKVLFCVFVHDEIDVEAPNNITDEVSNNLQSIMEKAAGRFYKKLVIPADASKGDHWIH